MLRAYAYYQAGLAPGQRRLLITSAHGVVFDIPARNRLDRATRRCLERFL